MPPYIFTIMTTIPPLWSHQKEALEFIKLRKNKAMIALPMGLGGKTRIALEWLASQDFKVALILCPHAVVNVWPVEAEKYFPGAFNFVIPDTGKPLLKRLEQLKLELRLHIHGGKVIIVLNYEAFMSKSNKRGVTKDPVTALKPNIFKFVMEYLVGQNSKKWIDVLICDESHRLKTSSGAISSAVHKVSKFIDNILLLTGTPFPHSLQDIYAQARVIDINIFGATITNFRNKYCIFGGFEGRQIVEFKNTQELMTKFASFAFQCDTSSLQLPPTIDNQINIDFETPKTRTLYNKLQRDLVIEVDNGVITAANAAVKILRLQQVTSGYAPDAISPGKVHRVSLAKFNALRDILLDLPSDEPVVVFGRFKADMVSIHQAAKDVNKTSSELSGKIDELAKWQAGETTVLAVNIKSGNAGIDLTRARYCIYFSVGYSLGDYLQSRKRIHRPGQTKTTYFMHLIVNKTVDVEVYKALEKREDVVNYILNGARSLQEAFFMGVV